MKTNTLKFRAYLLISLIALATATSTGRRTVARAQSCTTNPVVTTNADSGPGSLRDAIANACDGSTITFANSVTSPIVLLSELAIDKNLTIQGPGAGSLTISGNNTVRVFNLGSVTPGVAVTINDLTIADGKATGNPAMGGGILDSISNTLNLTGCIFTGNKALGEDFSEGGALITLGGLTTVTDCTFTKNTASAGGPSIADGGAVAQEAAMNMTGCTFTGNTANGGSGGGFYNLGGCTLTNCTFFGNSAAGGEGGAIFDQNTLTLINVTVAGNSAAAAGGIFQTGSSCIIHNTIVALNSATGSSPDVATGIFVFTSHGFNLIGKGDGAAGLANGVNNDQVGSVASPLSPGLQVDETGFPVLQNKGGPTETIALVEGSSAIDHGDDSVLMSPVSLETDQRGPGFPRKICKHVDIGSFEFNAPPVIDCPGNITASIPVSQTSASVNLAAASASDFCDGQLTPTYKIGNTVITSPHTFPVGVTTVTVSVASSTGLTAACSFTVTVAADFVCMKDDHTGNLFQFNTETGAYTYTNCSNNTTVSGTGEVTTVSGMIDLTDSESNVKVSAGFNPEQLTGRANITLTIAQGVYQTVTVSQTNPHATCACGT